ncbi:hypothetical protein PVM79_18425 [Bacillus licheniformis]|nr:MULTISPECIES: hypothetical protein [Bacillus]MBA1163674.1 hypothetical protein [Bacillus licheniformis]MBS2762968.1 hypothetical protein [Bacillus licheniformis]MDE1449929.1 hypothetical protein [Bacillus licheniformis]MEC2289310.1 hypothetical protein [Bacillus licheniformis]TWK60955.1 hypothetical protein CHCC20342_2521 [Bacillus licheniformis]
MKENKKFLLNLLSISVTFIVLGLFIADPFFKWASDFKLVSYEESQNISKFLKPALIFLGSIGTFIVGVVSFFFRGVLTSDFENKEN